MIKPDDPVPPVCGHSRRVRKFDAIRWVRAKARASLEAWAPWAFVMDGSAVTAVEFAALFPLFAGLVFTTAQVGLYFYFSTTLFYVTDSAMRQVMTGSVANQGLTAAQFRTQVLCPLLPGEMSCANVITNIEVVPNTSGGAAYWYNLTNKAAANNALGYTMTGLNAPPMNNANTSFCIGSGGSIVAAQVYYAMPILGLPDFLPNAGVFNGQPVLFISATSVLKNEPFVASTKPPC
jgi:Flp pilus assembly protein TadG